MPGYSLEADGRHEGYLIHEYFDIDLFLTWKVIKQELSLIKKKLSVILSSE
jgi:uncharacterized protein with HEPN domain